MSHFLHRPLGPAGCSLYRAPAGILGEIRAFLPRTFRAVPEQRPSSSKGLKAGRAEGAEDI